MGEPLPQELAPLSALSRSRMSVAEYFVPLLEHDDEVLAVGAWCAILERKQLPFAHFQRAVAYSKYGAVKPLAFEFFEQKWEHGLAAEVAAIDTEPETIAEQATMEAELAGDPMAAAVAYRRLYLATGRVDALVRELDYHYKAVGPLATLPIAARSLALNPHEAGRALRVLQLCLDAMRPDLIDTVAELLAGNGLHERLAAVYSGWACLIRGEVAAAQTKLADAARRPAAPAGIMGDLTRLAQRLSAEILEKQGKYREAHAAYLTLNGGASASGQDIGTFSRRMRAVAQIDVPALPAEDRTRWFTMTGFPRSGTTLLENALAAHPVIETFEELPTRGAMQLYLDRVLPRAKSPGDRLAAFIEARARYFGEMERKHRKSTASIFVDKSPIRSADAGFMVKAFPDQRYIFSIRHPFDVVLSCFRQAVAPDMAMDGFRTIESAAAFYDFTMTQWFGVYTLEDPRIHYLRYDDLVTQFEPKMREVLAFLGAEWSDSVLDFAAAAQTRPAATPSYQKVRQGLSIGVQSSWRKYGFLFQAPAARPLHKWAEFFGYPTK